ncbi:MAG: hypothetical protein GXY38_13095 [Planctomycetes bacterium]|jgi:bifunctional DNase/RNase|nr:hypothetical protein [Planctomycetota bacterium]
MYVAVELSRVLITEYGGDQLIFLREKGGDRTFPIVIGINEALAIHRRLNGEATPRPMTHDLLANVIDQMGGVLERIVIDDLRLLDHKDIRQTFIATLHVRRGEEVIKIDSRPSDAIALGSGLNTPIFVAEKVMDDLQNDSAQDRLSMLREHLQALEQNIGELSSSLDDKDFLAKAPPAVVKKARNQLDQMKREHEAICRVLKMWG